MTAPILTLYREAELLSERLGLWLLYEVSRTTDLDQFLGFVSYTAEGMAHLRAKAPEAKKQAIADCMTTWRRAARFLAGLDRSQYATIATSFLSRIKASARRRKTPIPYVAAGARHPWLTTRDAAPKRMGRPLIKPHPDARMECPSCGGFGLV